MYPLVSADVRGGGRLRDEPKEHLRRRLDWLRCQLKFKSLTYVFLLAVFVYISYLTHFAETSLVIFFLGLYFALL